MKRSTKRIVWSSACVGVVSFMLLITILLISTGEAPQKHVNADQMASVDEVVLEEPLAHVVPVEAH